MQWIVRMLDRPGGRLPLGVLMSLRLRLALGERVKVRYRDGYWTHRFEEGVVPELRPGVGGTLAEQEALVRDVFCQEYTPQPGDVIVDVGAGVGWELHLFSRLVGSAGHVFPIEAHPGTFQWLERRIRLNGMTNVTPIHAAVTDRKGEVHISDDEDHESNRIGSSAGHAVVAVTLDQVVSEQGIDRIDFLKMNIEGSERFAIRGMSSSIQIVRNACISCHDFLADRGDDKSARTMETVRPFLEEAGFAVRGRRPDEDRDWARGYLYGRRAGNGGEGRAPGHGDPLSGV
jgi:FkbM family methyltransferase